MQNDNISLGLYGPQSYNSIHAKLYIYCAQINSFLDQESPSHHFTGPMKVFKRHSVASNLIPFKVKRLRISMVLRLRHIYIYIFLSQDRKFKTVQHSVRNKHSFFIDGTTARRFVNPKFPYNYSSAISSKVGKTLFESGVFILLHVSMNNVI